jgi:hypothetical protein
MSMYHNFLDAVNCELRWLSVVVRELKEHPILKTWVYIGEMEDQLKEKQRVMPKLHEAYRRIYLGDGLPVYTVYDAFMALVKLSDSEISWRRFMGACLQKICLSHEILQTTFPAALMYDEGIEALRSIYSSEKYPTLDTSVSSYIKAMMHRKRIEYEYLVMCSTLEKAVASDTTTTTDGHASIVKKRRPIDTLPVPVSTKRRKISPSPSPPPALESPVRPPSPTPLKQQAIDFVLRVGN